MLPHLGAGAGVGIEVSSPNALLWPKNLMILLILVGRVHLCVNDYTSINTPRSLRSVC